MKTGMEKLLVLKQRIITALIISVVCITLLFSLSPFLFSLSVIPVMILAGWEWTNLAAIVSRLGKSAFLFALCGLVGLAAWWLRLGAEIDFDRGKQLSLAAVTLWAIIFLWIQGYPSSAILWGKKLVLAVIGLLVLTFTWIALVLIVHRPEGQWLFILAIAIVALADTGGYFAGKAFGKNKLAPVVSPGKTWEGFWGGILMQLVLIGLLLLLLPAGTSPVSLFLLVVPVALSSVIGDLFESMVKRHSGVKDSSHLLPGHGGILDRIDGFMAALPLYSLLLILLNVI